MMKCYAKNIIKKAILYISLVITVVMCCFCVTKNASALYSNKIIDKAILEGVYDCYRDGYVKKGENYESAIAVSFADWGIPSGQGNIVLPMFASTGLKQHSLTCNQLFGGYRGAYFFGQDGGIPRWISFVLGPTAGISALIKDNGDFIGIMEKTGHNAAVNPEILTGMGYTKSTTEIETDGIECISMQYDYNDDGNSKSGVYTTSGICYNKQDGSIFVDENIRQLKYSDGSYDDWPNNGFNPDFIDWTDGTFGMTFAGFTCFRSSLMDQMKVEKVAFNGNWETFKSEFKQFATNDAVRDGIPSPISCTHFENELYEISYSNGHFQEDQSQGSVSTNGRLYYFNDTKAAGEKAISYLSGGSYKTFADLAFSKQEQLDYYVDGLVGFFEDAEKSDYWRCVETNDADSIYGIEIKLDSALKKVKSGTTCKINTAFKANEGIVTELDPVDHFDTSSSTLMSIEDVIKKINNLADDPELEDSEGANTIEPDHSTEYTVEEYTDNCFKVAESLGWIVCPLIKKMGEAASGLYAQVSQEFIVIDAGFFEGGNSPIRIAWNDIVGFANAIMVIFLLVVVFSQITGVGIDNYGIKKVLPKIIIAAILINLSFLICQLAVELSNILGDALNTMFTNWAKNIPLEAISGQKIEEGKGLFFGLLNAISGGMLGLGAAEGASIALTIASAESTGVAIAGAVMSIIIPLLCALIIVIVAVFFFFILLGVRKACVIVLVVISPLAFVCYMLPNTKALFQKWWNALKGMLMLYPICGLMIGGGYYVSKLITSTSGNYFVQFTALLLMVVPYFFIPKMLTNSLAAMGSIGAKISGFGKNFGRRMSKSTRDASGRLGGAIKGTNRFKDWQERSAEKRTAGIVNRLRNRQKNGELSKYQTRKLAKYQSAANESYAKNLSREAVANEMHQEAVKANLDEKFADDSVRSAMSLYKNGGQYDINDVKGTGDRSMNAAYAAAIADYNGNKSSDNLAKIKALQNILSGTEDGRNIIQRNLSQAAMSGNADAVDTAKAAASHLLSEHGGTYKAANRSLHSMVTDMANGNVAGAASQYKDGSYDRKTIDSYEAASFAAADDAAIDKMVDEYRKILNKDNKDITAKDIEFTNKMENLVYDMTKEGSHINVKGKIRDKISIIPPIQHKQ